MGYLVFVQLAGPPVQFVAVGYLKRQMVKADPAFVERSQIGRRAVRHQSHRETRRVKHGSALIRPFVDLVDQGEAEDVVPPLRSAVAVCNRQVDVREPQELWHVAESAPK